LELGQQAEEELQEEGLAGQVPSLEIVLTTTKRKGKKSEKNGVSVLFSKSIMHKQKAKQNGRANKKLSKKRRGILYPQSRLGDPTTFEVGWRTPKCLQAEIPCHLCISNIA
jgi:hypothetical protein